MKLTFREFLREMKDETNGTLDWGFIDPDGKVISGVKDYGFPAGDYPEHLKLVDLLGGKSYTDLFEKGYIRYAVGISPSKGLSGMFDSPVQPTNGRVRRFIEEKFPRITWVIVDRGHGDFWNGDAPDLPRDV